MRTTMLALLALVLLVTPSWAVKPEQIVIIINEEVPESKQVGEYYAAKRKIPAKNICRVKCGTKEIIDTYEYRRLIEKPVKQFLEKTGLNKTAEYLVLAKGMPLRLGEGRSVDGMLMCMDIGLDVLGTKSGVSNPYFNKKESFSRKKFGFYLATRLDGYTAADAKALVDRSLAAKPEKGLFLFDGSPGRQSGGYKLMSLHMSEAHDLILRKGYVSIHDSSAEFIGGKPGLMGYFSWGSNDKSFDRAKYKSNKFLPGAIAETPVSTSARTFKRTDEGQSLIADLIESGVTGVKGYVAEPTLAAVADPRVMFDRYLSGYNLAESFYMASRWILWRDIVIGDPMCAPYAK